MKIRKCKYNFGNNNDGVFSTINGYATETNNFGETAVGILNKSTLDPDTFTSPDVVTSSKATLFSVGNGSDNVRKNAFEIKANGDTYINGVGGYDGTNSEDATSVGESIQSVQDSSNKFAEDIESIHIEKSATGDTYVLKVAGEDRGTITDESGVSFTPGNGLQLVDTDLSVKIDPTSESYLTAGQDGLKISGIDAKFGDYLPLTGGTVEYLNIGDYLMIPVGLSYTSTFHISKRGLSDFNDPILDINTTNEPSIKMYGSGNFATIHLGYDDTGTNYGVEGVTIHGKTSSDILTANASTVKISTINGTPVLDKTVQAFNLAPLENGLIPAAYLPGYVDDVLEYDSVDNFPETGESGKIYIATDTNMTYRWAGSSYVAISSSLALGETSSTAYAGDKGKANRDALNSLPSTLISSISRGEITGSSIVINVNQATKSGLNYESPVAANLTFTAATNSIAGLMSASDKQKLDGLSNYTLPVASATSLGGVCVGDGLEITEEGVLNCTIDPGSGTVSWGDIQGKPTFSTVATSGLYSDLTGTPDLSNYVTSTQLTSIAGSNTYTGANYISKETNLTDAVIQLDEEVKATNDNLALEHANAEATYVKKAGDTMTGDLKATKFIGPLQGNADTATKATQDANGDVIADTYAKKAELSSYLPLTGGSILYRNPYTEDVVYNHISGLGIWINNDSNNQFAKPYASLCSQGQNDSLSFNLILLNPKEIETSKRRGIFIKTQGSYDSATSPTDLSNVCALAFGDYGLGVSYADLAITQVGIFIKDKTSSDLLHAAGGTTKLKTINSQSLLGEGNIEIQVEGGGITDAPSDGKLYGRKNAQWAEVTIPEVEVPTKVSELTNDLGFQTEAQVSAKISALVDSAPETLDTLNELAAALGDDPNFATTITTQLGNKLDTSTYNSDKATFALKSELPSVESITTTDIDALFS